MAAASSTMVEASGALLPTESGVGVGAGKMSGSSHEAYGALFSTESGVGVGAGKMSGSSHEASGSFPTWADRLKSSSGSVARSKLQYFEPSWEDSVPVVIPPPEVEEEGTKKWEDCLVGHLFDSKMPFAVVRSIIFKICARFGILEVIPHGDGFFIFRFSQSSAAKDVLEGGPWLISGRHLLLRWWSPGLSWRKESVSKVPVWVQFHNVPMEFWTPNGLSYIASAVGVPLYADSSTEACSRMAFARICVELDASKPLIHEFRLQTSSRNANTPSNFTIVKVLYQWKPRSCSFCKVFGHADNACPNHQPPCPFGCRGW